MGTEEATRLLLQHRKVLFAHIQAIVRDPARAEDLFQEVSLVVLRRWDEFGDVRDCWSLAREIARRQALAALRKEGREPVLLSEAALDAVDLGFDSVAGGGGGDGGGGCGCTGLEALLVLALLGAAISSGSGRS